MYLQVSPSQARNRASNAKVCRHNGCQNMYPLRPNLHRIAAGTLSVCKRKRMCRHVCVRSCGCACVCVCVRMHACLRIHAIVACMCLHHMRERKHAEIRLCLHQCACVRACDSVHFFAASVQVSVYACGSSSVHTRTHCLVHTLARTHIRVCCKEQSELEQK